MSIVLEQLTKRYDGHPVVNHVSLEIADGELFVLLGPSGSGKSTILRLIAGLTDSDEGRMVLHGRDVTFLPPQQRGAGFVFQHYALFRHMSVAENIEFALRQNGYLVIEAAHGGDALSAFEREQPELVILDVNLPGLSGFDVCRRIREQADTPIMMLTVRSSEEDEVKGLDLGADDYLTKPFSPRTLLARVRALLRRAEADRPAPSLKAGDLALDGERQTVSARGGAPVRLTNLEFRLLQYLIANAGHTLSFDKLTNHVWGYRGAGDRQLLKQLVHRLRQKIEADPAEPQCVVTVAGVGYVLQTMNDG